MKPARLLQQTMQSTTSHPKIFDTHPSKMVVELLLVLKPVIHNATNHTNSKFLKQSKYISVIKKCYYTSMVAKSSFSNLNPMGTEWSTICIFQLGSVLFFSSHCDECSKKL